MNRNTIALAAVVLVSIVLTVGYIYSEDYIPRFCPPCQEQKLLLTPDTTVKEVKLPDIFHRGKMPDLLMDKGLLYEQPSSSRGRPDVNQVTPWCAPLVWNATFNPVVVNNIYQRINPRIAVLVLAVHRYTRFLKGFLETAEKYFLVGFRVTYYIFTDHAEEVPDVTLAQGRKITVLEVPHAKRWQDVVFSRMKRASNLIEEKLHKEADYLFMMDIDSLFHNPVGPEILSRLTATLHRAYFKGYERDRFPYDRNPDSKAHIPAGEGDYYYTAAVFGGYMEDMYKLVQYCWEMSQEDAKNGIEAAWQEESHLNRYFLYNKPTKVLSPEYLWSDYDTPPPEVKVIRISQLVKNYGEVRPNGGQ